MLRFGSSTGDLKIFFEKGSMTDWLEHNSFCRTAPVTPGLSKMACDPIYKHPINVTLAMYIYFFNSEKKGSTDFYRFLDEFTMESFISAGELFSILPFIAIIQKSAASYISATIY